MNSAGENCDEHVARRERFAGRWGSAAFYVLNVLLWFLTGVAFEAWDVLWLVVLTVPAIALYVWRTGWSRIARS